MAMTVEFYKYHGAGNDFLIADNRDGALSLSKEQVAGLCDRRTGFGADGLILLEDVPGKDFGMVYFNSDGSGGMMCGNGGRCILAFALDRGVVSGEGGTVEFDAPDGPHEGIFIDNHAQRRERTVRLKMRDVLGIEAFPSEGAFFLDTGTRHFVKFVEGLDAFPVSSEGARLRWDPRFAPVGTNVNFVESVAADQGTLLHIRTFEKGVEDETLACGTGMVAAAMAAWSSGIPGTVGTGGSVRYLLKPAIAELGVEFVPSGSGAFFVAEDVWLTGPAVFVGRAIADL